MSIGFTINSIATYDVTSLNYSPIVKSYSIRRSIMGMHINT